ncbi:CDP-diacylglycerol--serine O-phosphatidyltransferase [Orenia metallireducens]|jgi:CDP-diacylglycerol--serine O-phosphatidyltransferase|uniref:CDP-diacylglycerol--serine O-phosphatidyltransferase n=1 Tax=Orenia metallireducens TaxID=1413210 RepID=A0A285HVE4_9FIRM|nr:CDP-diacylglycerol--serine O-phosphatidyltransferase [Orenia metallireducens]PRX24050.1 CDP-diacylglycerol--serine O-phosphatidyltransferase [Orenia metallireducens]SNY38701.1 CDP-diacylglycerol---serine O-phosphatidyltransferase [Orenia metallireducens]
MIREFLRERSIKESIDLKLIPCAVTMGNLSCGIIAILAIIQEEMHLAPMFILLAGLFDVFDGRLARGLKATSDLGKELDSLADIVSFGIAPAILVWRIGLIGLGGFGLLLTVLFPMAGALRLARYNITEFDGTYVGVPITVAGALLSFVSFFSYKYSVSVELLILLIIVLSYLMISKIKIPKL